MKQAALFGGVITGLMVLGGGAVAADYQVCQSTYALCTTAKCTTDPTKADSVECACEVRTGYSVGTTACQEPKDTSAGKQVISRYYPVKSYAQCANNRPWAWCLDKECVVNKDDPSKATCACSVKENAGSYVMITDSYSAETCTVGLWSSATVTDLEEVTDVLKGQKDLQPFPIEVLKTDTLGSMHPSSAK